MSLKEYLIESIRIRVQHFNPQKYFAMRNKVVTSGGGNSL